MALILGISKGNGFTVKDHLIVLETLISPTSFEVAVFKDGTLLKSGVFVGYQDQVEILPEVFLQAGDSTGGDVKFLVTAPKQYRVSRVKCGVKMPSVSLDVTNMTIAKAVLQYWSKLTDGQSESALREFVKLSVPAKIPNVWEYGACSFLIVDGRLRSLRVHSRANRLCKHCLNSGVTRQWDDDLEMYQNIRCIC